MLDSIEILHRSKKARAGSKKKKRGYRNSISRELLLE
jgi:hypothetical protein